MVSCDFNQFSLDAVIFLHVRCVLFAKTWNVCFEFPMYGQILPRLTYCHHFRLVTNPLRVDQSDPAQLHYIDLG